MISGQKEEDWQDQFLRAGAYECLTKPFTSGHLITRVQIILRRSHIRNKTKRLSGEKDQVRDALSREIEKLHQINRTIVETDVIDRLTGLYNKIYFMLRLREEFHRAIRYETALSLVVIDLDSFTLINNNFGHAVGDYILMKVANTLLLSSKMADTVGRMDGAAFAVILPDTDIQGGVFDAERFRIAIQQTEYIDKSVLNVKDSLSGKKFPKIDLTASAGVVTIPSSVSPTNEQDFFELAMKALGQAKAKGKNRTVSAAELGVE
jgi:diguanylate cyclase (GGDEF)-like protein